MTSRSLLALLSASGVSALVVLALSGCAAGPTTISPAASNDAASTPAVTATTSVFALKVGDCLNDVGHVEVQSLPVVDCGGPHDYEVFDEYEAAGGDYPGDNAMIQMALGYCAGALEGFVGVPYEASALDINYLTPTEDSWSNGGDRQISCLVFDPAGKVNGTLQGAAR